MEEILLFKNCHNSIHVYRTAGLQINSYLLVKQYLSHLIYKILSIIQRWTFELKELANVKHFLHFDNDFRFTSSGRHRTSLFKMRDKVDV